MRRLLFRYTDIDMRGNLLYPVENYRQRVESHSWYGRIYFYPNGTLQGRVRLSYSIKYSSNGDLAEVNSIDREYT